MRSLFRLHGTGGELPRARLVLPVLHSVICHEHAHIQNDECGAPEFFFSNGTKLSRARREWEAHGGGIAELASRRTDIITEPRRRQPTQSTNSAPSTQRANWRP